MGVVIDEELAKKTGCLCYQIGPTKEPWDLLCWSKGVIGTLTDRQEAKYCPTKEIKPATEGLKDRLEKFIESIHAAQKRYKGEGIQKWLDLVSEEMGKRGL